ncbi:MAG: nuclease-related domain-containing protein [Candidatus Peribacteraceae bacterium]|nr:nuclease-related domain-containing protein [Candidatus Peribacteraceae bacterium]
MKNTCSPINQIPLRNPGDALFQKRMWIFEGIELLMVLAVIMGIFTAWEWVRWFREVPPNPVGSSIIFGIVCLFVGMRIIRNVRALRNYDLGLIGERYVAERLEELRANGYHIIHDIPCGRMNIDHVLVGPAGVFTIETKMARKESGAPSEIAHTDQGVFMNGKRGWSGKALWEAEKEAEYLQAILIKDGSRSPHIQPVVVYPGWFVKDDCSRKIWVLNDRYLMKKIRSLPSILSLENIQNIRRKIEKYSREKTAESDYA